MLLHWLGVTLVVLGSLLALWSLLQSLAAKRMIEIYSRLLAEQFVFGRTGSEPSASPDPVHDPLPVAAQPPPPPPTGRWQQPSGLPRW